jgi:hypothetical protein
VARCGDGSTSVLSAAVAATCGFKAAVAGDGVTDFEDEDGFEDGAD